MLLLLVPQGIAVLSTLTLTLPINCQLAITHEPTEASNKYRVGEAGQLGSAQFKSVFDEK